MCVCVCFALIHLNSFSYQPHLLPHQNFNQGLPPSDPTELDPVLRITLATPKGREVERKSRHVKTEGRLINEEELVSNLRDGHQPKSDGLQPGD